MELVTLLYHRSNPTTFIFYFDIKSLPVPVDSNRMVRCTNVILSALLLTYLATPSFFFLYHEKIKGTHFFSSFL